MRILVFGAGVLGSLYAARLKEAGQDVTVLARGARLEQVREHGIVLVDAATGRQTTTHLEIIERLEPEDEYDLVMVMVRKNQLDEVLPQLAANHRVRSYLFMFNNASGPEDLMLKVGRERVLLGFPGAGGVLEGHVVRYAMLPTWLQPTTIGEVGGQRTERIDALYEVLHNAGFSTLVNARMDAWLKTHIAVVSPVANALYLANGSVRRLSRTRDGVLMMVRAIREALDVLEDLGIPITPARFRLFRWIPEPLLVLILQLALNTRLAEIVIEQHANAARDEMEQLTEEFKTLQKMSFVRTPTLDQLTAYLNPETPSLPKGSAVLAMNWHGLWVLAGGLAAISALLGGSLFHKRGKKSR